MVGRLRNEKINEVLIWSLILIIVALCNIVGQGSSVYADNKNNKISVEGFAPQLVRLEFSQGTVAPGETIEMKWVWRNVGNQPFHIDMTVFIHFRGPNKFFQGDYSPSIPTFKWEPGKIITDIRKVTVPADAPPGRYYIIVGMYDNLGRIQWIPLATGNKTRRGGTHDFPEYGIGELIVSATSGNAEPLIFDLSNEPIDLPGAKVVTPPGGSQPTEPESKGKKDILFIGDKHLGVGLARDMNFALDSIIVDGVVFESGGTFPSFVVNNKDGKPLVFMPGDKDWRCQLKTSTNMAEIVYERDGFAVVTRYEVAKDMIVVSLQPIKETEYKALSITDRGSIVCVHSDKENALETAFLLVPYGGGEKIRFPIHEEEVWVSHLQDWMYPAGFLGVGYRGRGLLIRCPQYGANFTYGTGNVGGKHALSGGIEVSFRPGCANFAMPLVEGKIEIQIVPVSDANRDGGFDWVDLGVAYRDRFIEPNKSLDQGFIGAVSGKIGISATYDNIQTYDQLLEQIKAVDFAPQVWWLVGAHTSPDRFFCDPPYSGKPHPSHGDYFAFKEKAAEMGARIGIHEMPQDISEDCPEWGKVPLRHGKPSVSWEGVTEGKRWTCYAKAINDDSFYRFLDGHFKDWDVKAGDTWHWDVFTAESSKENCDPSRPATRGTDFRTRIKILQYVKNKGIHITSEGLQEGVSTYCDMAYQAKIAEEPEKFTGAELVPLTPVLFLGRTYYGSGVSPVSRNLLYGGRGSPEDSVIDKDNIIRGYFVEEVYWGKIANRTVLDIDRTDVGWNVRYKEGGSLTANINSGTFVLEVDGKTYDETHPPASPKGVKAKLVNGKYELSY